MQVERSIRIFLTIGEEGFDSVDLVSLLQVVRRHDSRITPIPDEVQSSPIIPRRVKQSGSVRLFIDSETGSRIFAGATTHSQDFVFLVEVLSKHPHMCMQSLYLHCCASKCGSCKFNPPVTHCSAHLTLNYHSSSRSHPQYISTTDLPIMVPDTLTKMLDVGRSVYLQPNSKVSRSVTLTTIDLIAT